MKDRTVRILLYTALLALVISVLLTVVSIYPLPTGNSQSVTRIDDSFNLTVNEIRRQGLGNFRGGENVTIHVSCPTTFSKDFSIAAYSGLRYNNTFSSGFVYNFTAGADYYEAIFQDASQSGQVNLKVIVEQTQTTYPYSWLNAPAKILFLASLSIAIIVLLILALLEMPKSDSIRSALPSFSSPGKQRLQLLIFLSLVCWLVVLAVNSSPYSSFETWYTDHSRHSYTASLFLKDSFSVFNQPLGVLANQDNSIYKFVTWPEMPHLYPLGSILLFLPFGVLLQNGVTASFVYKLEITLFLFFAHMCLYFFLCHYWQQTFYSPLNFRGWKEKLRRLSHVNGWSQNRFEISDNIRFLLKLIGVYVIYTTLIVFAADGMFDSVAFIFALFAITAFLTERYDAFFLLTGVSVFFKYQAAIFLMPLILFGFLRLIQIKKLGVFRNKFFLIGSVFFAVSASTAVLSAPYIAWTRPELVMNSINAFMPNSQIPWSLQTSAVFSTLVATLVYVLYIYRKNQLLSLSALLLLAPSFLLPFFQNWYIPFVFCYILIPQRKNEIISTMIWLIFLIIVLSFGASAFNSFGIIDNLR